MSNTSNSQSPEFFFGNVISTYSRAQAIADGVLTDPGAIAKEAGIVWPIAITAGAWADCVAWTEADSERQVYQDQAGRLWDVIYMASHAIRTCKRQTNELQLQVYRVPRDGKSTEPELVTLKMIAGPGDAGEPVITVLLPHED